MIAAMRESMPAAEFAAWVIGSGLFGMGVGPVLRWLHRRRGGNR